MKVIKRGREQTGWSKRMTCTGKGNGGGGCRAILLVEQGDVFITHSCHYDGSHETYQTFRCSECGVRTDIEEHLPFRPRAKEERLRGGRKVVDGPTTRIAELEEVLREVLDALEPYIVNEGPVLKRARQALDKET